jgi:hypothetical protein
MDANCDFSTEAAKPAVGKTATIKQNANTNLNTLVFMYNTLCLL